MQNLAGVSGATIQAAMELERAGIPIVPAVEPEHETRTEIEGEMHAGAYVIRFTRRWAYWSAKVSPPLPVDLAVALNEAPGVGGGSKYSGDGATLGSVVRAHGFAGGMPSGQVREWGWCERYHIDTPEGLKAFATWLMKYVGTPPTQP